MEFAEVEAQVYLGQVRKEDTWSQRSKFRIIVKNIQNNFSYTKGKREPKAVSKKKTNMIKQMNGLDTLLW